MNRFHLQNAVERQHRLRWILFISTIFFLTFFRPRWAFRPNLPFDDLCYLEWLHKLMHVPYPQCYSTAHTAGIAFLWLPVGFLAKIMAVWTAYSLDDWLTPLVGVLSYGFWALSFWGLDRLRGEVPNVRSLKLSVGWTLAFLLNIPVLLYATKETIGTHPGELLLCVGVVWPALRGRLVWGAALSLLLILTRLNDVPVLFLLFGAAVDRYGAKSLTPLSAVWRRRIGITAAMGVAIVCVPLYRIGFVTGYNGVLIPDVLKTFTLQRFYHALFMGGWGLVWVQPVFLLLLAMGTLYWRKLSNLSRGALVWMAVEYFFVISVTGIRDDYPAPPFRYLTGAYVGGMVVWLEILPLLSSPFKKIVNGALVAGGVWMSYITYFLATMHMFRYNGITSAWTGDWTLLQMFEFLRHPFTIVELLALGPVGFTVYSRFSAHPLFARFTYFSKYALHGAELWVGLAVSVLALALFLWFAGVLFFSLRKYKVSFRRSFKKTLPT